MTDRLYTEQEVKILLLENNQSAMLKTLDKIESRMDKIESRIGSLQHWTIGLILGLYALFLSELIPYIFKIFAH